MKKLVPAIFLFLFFHAASQAQLTDHRRYAPDMVYVKFTESAGAYVQNGRLNLPGHSVPAELEAMGNWRAVYSLSPERMSQLHQTAERNLGKKLPDPNTNFYFRLNDVSQFGHVLEIIGNLPNTERIQRVPVTVNAAAPDYFSLQTYHHNVNSGIDADSAWTVYPVRGEGIKVCDIEYCFNPTHQDLPPVTILGHTPIDPFAGESIDHGTAVLGEIASLDNSTGTTGIAPDCDLYFAGAYTDMGYDLASAISNALSVLSAGDVILLEQQIDGPNYSGTPDQFGLVPVEWFVMYYDAIVLAVGQNVTVVEAAGNGQQDLDDTVYSTDNGGHYPFLPENNSGAILVGAGAVDVMYYGSDMARSKLWYSNYGSRVDVQGNGEAVFTTGYGDLYDVEGENSWYTAQFGGTSGASPIVTGAVTVLQSINKNITGNTLMPGQIREALINTGKPQQAGTYPLSNHIGPLPDLILAQQYIIAAGMKEKETRPGFSVFPNPGNGIFNLHAAEWTGTLSLKVFDMNGQMVVNNSYNSNNLRIDLSGLQNGLYLVQLSNGENTVTEKLAIEK
jgi:subtilisin family serine protease